MVVDILENVLGLSSSSSSGSTTSSDTEKNAGSNKGIGGGGYVRGVSNQVHPVGGFGGAAFDPALLLRAESEDSAVCTTDTVMPAANGQQKRTAATATKHRQRACRPV